MLTNIKVKNFKSLKDISIATKPLNVLMGLNGMGKSSLIQSLLILMQSDKLEEGVVDLNGTLVQIGQGKDALYQFAEKDFISLSVSLDNDLIYEWNLIYNRDKDKLKTRESAPKVNFQKFTDTKKLFQYISAERIGPRDLYDSSSILVEDKKQIGLLGEFAANFLNTFGTEYSVNEKLRHKNAKSEKLIDQVNSWLSEISPGVTLNTKYLPDVNKIILDYQFEFGHNKTNSFRPKNVGFGISYVLPIIVSLLTAEPGKTIVIENPESHIHPRGQAEMGRMISLATTTGAQLFIETHSDHIINGIRVAVKEKLVNKEQVNILFFDKESNENEQFTKVTPIKVDQHGELNDYPQNFLDEWANQLLKLL